MPAPSIVEIHPADGSTGIALADSVYVVFDREVDPTTVSVMVEGPDTDKWSGPDQVTWDDVATDADDDVLASPGYHGLVDGTLSFEKIDADGDTISALDYTGGGTLWYTKVTFTPTVQFAANTTYRIYVVGDETDGDEIVSGVSSRTVFDTVKGSNLGDGDVTFSGGYTGTIDDDFLVKVKEAGEASEGLTFHWWKATLPLIVHELTTKESSQFLSDGVLVQFSGTFAVDDEFEVVVEPGVRMENTYTWSFTTGSGSIVTVPSSVAQQPSIPVGGFSPVGAVSATGRLSVVSTTPKAYATNLDPASVTEIVIVFDKELDADTITDDTVEVWSEPVNGDSDIPAAGALAKILSVDDKTLTIQIG